VPREVFAEEIEAFLERLDAVAAARVVANEAGEIERIYVTTESSRDDGTVRRAITAALMSQFSLPVDGWRVQIAHLEQKARPEGLPRCQLVRLEETITETMTRAAVDLRYAVEGAQKILTGSAQAPPGQAHRPRTVALATLEALRPLIERSGYRASLEGLLILPFAGASVVVAAVSLATDRASVLHVGAEPVITGEGEAAVGAILDAVAKSPRAGGTPYEARTRADRRQQFEGLRQHYERLIRQGPAGAPPASLGPPSEPTGGPDEETRGLATGPSVATLPGPPQAGPDSWPGLEASEPVSAPEWSDEIVSDLSEIRPERQGGASVMREELRADGPAAAKGAAAGRLSVEDAFYRRLVAAGAPVYIRCRDGYEIPSAIVRDYGTYSLMVEVNGVQELVFKHGIIAIRPYGPLPPEPGTLS
jgi:sRNA-binding regulator protein Hfq